MRTWSILLAICLLSMLSCAQPGAPTPEPTPAPTVADVSQFHHVTIPEPVRPKRPHRQIKADKSHPVDLKKAKTILGVNSIPIAWTVPFWAIDAQNSTGCASDNNTCQSATCSGSGIGPCVTFAQVLTRLGTRSPTFMQDTTIEWVTTPATAIDQVEIHPNQNTNFFGLSLTADLPTPCAGIIASNTAHNRTAGTLPSVKVAACLTKAGLLLVNSTRGNSVAFTESVLDAPTNTWNITQPWNPSTEREVTTWANTDAVNVYDLQPLEIGAVGIDGSGLLQITNVKETNSADSFYTSGTGFTFIGTSNLTTFFADTTLFGTQVESSSLVQAQIGGILAASGVHDAQGFTVQGPFPFISDDTEIITDSPGRVASFTAVEGWGAVYFGPQGAVVTGTIVASASSNTDSTIGTFLWGPGALSTSANGYLGVIPGVGSTNAVTAILSTAVNPMFLGGGVGNANGCSATIATPSVQNCGISLTPAHLDAVAGAAGFGNVAFMPGLSSIVIGNR